ncbi:MAG TPA: hypothetical protein VL442_06840 [Mucilaginibacter sp.]|jgi:protein ImuA|nr:hypothetical protein [Mucilaginibacter sp.]
MITRKEEIIAKLRQEIIAFEGFRPPQQGVVDSFGLGLIENAFPNQVFPTGVLHELLSSCPEETAATGGFIAGLVKCLLSQGGICLWVSWSRRIYPPALKLFGVDPDRVIFVDVPLQKDLLWVAEESLKCEGVAAVVCESKDLSFMESRRLQLAVEKSNVTGFILRKDIRKINTTACAARWQIRPVRSRLRPGMPGVGFPRWSVELLKVKNGMPGKWTVEWRHKHFLQIVEQSENKELRQYA